MIGIGKGRVLVLAAHPDDEFGCAGLIAIHGQLGSEIRYHAFTDCSASMEYPHTQMDLEEECQMSLRTLAKVKEMKFHGLPVRHLPQHRQNILEILVSARKEYSPTVVLCPSSADIHQDHQQLSIETRRAFRDTTVLGYELPYNSRTFIPMMYVELTEETLALKEKALSAYESQKHRYHGTSDYARTMASFRGTQCRRRYAEAYEVLQMIGEPLA